MNTHQDLNSDPYQPFISANLKKSLADQLRSLPGIPGLSSLGPLPVGESPEALAFANELYQKVKARLFQVLEKREGDRRFLDTRMKACVQFNEKAGIDFESPEYLTPLGLKDGEGRIVFGPLREDFADPGGDPVAPFPKKLGGPQITLFGPPDSPKMALNAMNSYHRKLPHEPKIISELLSKRDYTPRWGADVEDSKTPLRRDMASASKNIAQCLRGNLEFFDSKKQKQLALAQSHRAIPFKRFPGLALPCGFLFSDGINFPLHIYDFALHVFQNWEQEDALLFYVPKLENEEEAQYIHYLVSTAEDMIADRNPSFKKGSTRLMIVLENPRAILRANEIMDALHPYFLGASLGWHDYLASTARLFKENSHYRIPVKADPDIVIKHIKASHDLVARVVGDRGALALGGMYGVLPLDSSVGGPSFSVALKGFFRDVITQLKRGLQGFWVAHPDFVRIGIALVIAWEEYKEGKRESLEVLLGELFDSKVKAELLAFADGPDIQGLDSSKPLYIRELIVASLGQSDYIPNNHPEEIRYNVFQTLQYLADWLAGNGCVALPAIVSDTSVRIMDDLATTERSRWEVWHEIAHGRFKIDAFLKIAFEEFEFIQKGQAQGSKLVQIGWDERTGPWYPVAFHLMLLLMCSPEPVEFATQVLMPFALDPFREGQASLDQLLAIDPEKYQLPARVRRYLQYFGICGSHSFAAELSKNPLYDPKKVKNRILAFKEDELLEAAAHHGDIGGSRALLDELASKEQAGLAEESQNTLEDIQKEAARYLEKFGFKFLVFASGKKAKEFKEILQRRLKNSRREEVLNALDVLAQIALHRAETLGLKEYPWQKVSEPGSNTKFPLALGLQEGPPSGEESEKIQTLYQHCGQEHLFDIASLSKTVGTAFSLEILGAQGYTPMTPVKQILQELGSPLKLEPTEESEGPETWFDNLRIQDLMQHSALNMHYVNGIPAGKEPPSIGALLEDPERFSYQWPAIKNPPGTRFAYSGAGFLLLEHIMELILGAEKQARQEAFLGGVLSSMGPNPTASLSFDRKKESPRALGHWDSGQVVSTPPLWFPGYAAGALANPMGMLSFLGCLYRAYHDVSGCGPISHDTAVLMLGSHRRTLDAGSRDFMGLDIGLGIFTAPMGPNQVAIHQGANDGYRSLFFLIYHGPDQGKAFCAFYGGDNHGVPLIAEIGKDLIEALDIQGFDPSLLSKDFGTKGIIQEEIVNQGYKELFFKGFISPLPALHPPKTESSHPFFHGNLLGDKKPLGCSDQRFARAENLVRSTSPCFDPLLFCDQGKVMDSWETARHNQQGYDWVIFPMDGRTTFRFLYASTAFHHGNHARAFSILGHRGEYQDHLKEWTAVLESMATQGHSELFLDLGEDSGPWDFIQVRIYPDGGFSRLALFPDPPPSPELMEPRDSRRAWAREPQWHLLENPIPRPDVHPVIPLDSLPKGNSGSPSTELVDLASSLSGGAVEKVSNEHYGPAASLISPVPGLHMFDGLESARSREAGHFEEAVISLGKAGMVQKIELDFSHFINNNPMEVEIFAQSDRASDNNWELLSPRTPTKAFAGNTKMIQIQDTRTFTKIKLRLHPDGGLNRIRVWGIPTEAQGRQSI